MSGSGEREGLVQRLVRASVQGPLSPMLVVLATVAGLVAVLLTPREEEPQIVVPMADVHVEFPGASAEEVEKLVATPLEKLLWQVDGVEHVYSMSRRDHAVVTVRFFVGEDRERALVRLQSRIDANRDAVPPGVTGWVVKPVEIDDVPIVTLTFWSESLDASDADLRRVAEEMGARLDQAEDLSRSEIVGGRSREVRVELDPEALAAHGLSPLEVSRALQAADASLPSGAFVRADRRYPVVAGPFVGGRREVEGLVVGAHEGRPVYLRDVASRVVDGPAESTAYVRMGFGPADRGEGREPGRSHPAVTLALSKKKGTNAVWVAHDVVARAETLAREVLPPDVRMSVTRNYGHTADEKVNELLGHLALAIITVIGLIAYALGWREGLIVAAAVPITFALTLLVNLLAGYTINRVTLFALVLVLGLVCDDPIVDVENIHRHFSKRRLPPLQAVLFAVNEVRPPVIFATVAVILSFVPMLFITGMMGPYMRPMALNVPVAMAMSLFVAFTITPWMSFYLLRPLYGKPESHGPRGRGILGRAYAGLVGGLLDHRWLRWALLVVVVGLAGVAGLIALSGAVPLKMLPYDNKSELQLVIDLPEGTTLERTDAVVRDFERRLARVPEVRDYQTYAGTSSPIDFNGLVRHYGLRQAPHLADIRVNLLPKGEREQQSHDIGLRLRDGLEAIAQRHGARLKIVETPPGPPVLSTIVAEVHGPPHRSYDDLIRAARDLEGRLAALEGVVDTDVMAEEEHTRLDFLLDKEKAALHGVVTADVVRTLRLALHGHPAATVHEPGERQPLYLRLVLDRAHRSGAEELSRLQVKGTTGVLVPLAEIGRFVERPDDQTIYHKDLERVVFVLGEVAGAPPPDVVLTMQEDLRERPLKGGVQARWDGEGEWKITLEVFRDLGLAFLGACLAIYALLVVETRSFFMPVVVMLSIPLGAIGIMPGFWLLNRLAGSEVGGYASPIWFTATGMIGMIALAGIVIRNAIILIDFIRSHTAQGMDPREAVIQAGRLRLRPIVLTAFTTMLGAWPITLDPIFSGLAWSLIFGIVASTAFTLVVIPVVFYAFYARRPRPAAAGGEGTLGEASGSG